MTTGNYPIYEKLRTRSRTSNSQPLPKDTKLWESMIYKYFVSEVETYAYIVRTVKGIGIPKSVVNDQSGAFILTPIEQK